MKTFVTRPNTPINGLLLGWEENPSNKTALPIWDTSREGHLITIAPTGSGKGVSCAIPALLTWQGPAIVFDPRGENYAVTAERRRAMGHVVHRLDPFSVAGPGGDSLNPMDLIDPHADDFEDNAAVVASLCMQGGSLGRSDPYWDERGVTLVVKLITRLFEVMESRLPTLRDVQEGLKGLPIHDSPLSGVSPNGDTNPAAQKSKAFLLKSILNPSEFASDRTLAGIISTASSHMGFLRSPAVHASLTDSTIVLDDITAGAMQTIYIIIPPDKLVSHNKLVRLWLGVMLAAVAKRQRAPAQPTLFLIDETAQLGELSELRAALTLMRAYGMRVWCFFQDLSQLQSVYARDWQSIINNCKVQQYFGANSPHARASLETYLGKAMPVDGIPEGHQLLYDGARMITTRRPDYLRDPLLKGMASPHPFHMPQKELILQ